MAPTRVEMSAVLRSWSTERLWQTLLAHGRTLLPSWVKATHVCAERCNVPDDKRDKHLAAIATAFDRMDDWRTKRIKYGRARRDEIDSVISFTWDRALQRSVAGLRVASSIRNGPGGIRAILYTACHGYGDDQIPEVVAAMLYRLAATKTLFPFNFSTLFGITLKLPKPEGSDYFVDRLHYLSVPLAYEDELKLLLAEVTGLWEHIEHPKAWEFPEAVWSEEARPRNASAYYAAVKAFHANAEPRSPGFTSP